MLRHADKKSSVFIVTKASAQHSQNYLKYAPTYCAKHTTSDTTPNEFYAQHWPEFPGATDWAHKRQSRTARLRNNARRVL